jgi:hypothetical protein
VVITQQKYPRPHPSMREAVGENPADGSTARPKMPGPERDLKSLVRVGPKIARQVYGET